MKICILGAGLQGRVAAQDLAQNNHQVTVIDINKDNLSKVKRETLRNAQSDKSAGIKTKQFDVTKKKELIKFIRDFDIVVGALPAYFGFYSMQCAIEAKVDMADMSYSEQNPFLLDKQAKKNKIRIVPDAGYAPGLSNILIGEAYREFNEQIHHRDTEKTQKKNLTGSKANKISRLRILVGGIPQNPIPPFNYKYTWSPNDLVAEYTRPARIVNNYKVVTTEALTGIEKFRVPKIGELECFYTDGLRTLIQSFKDIKNMEEKTVRYSGHAQLLKELLNYGFAPGQDNPFTNSKIQPKDFILDFLKDAFSNVRQGFSLANKSRPKGLLYNISDELDLTFLMIDIKGSKKSRRYTCIDYYDKKNKITSMARMTAYSGSIITQCLKNYPEFGVIAPEKLGIYKDTCNYIKREIAKRNIIIRVKNY